MMRLILQLTVLAVAVFAAAVPATARIDTERMLSGRATGPAVHCIRQRDIVGQTLVNQSVIVFEMRGHRYYRNDITPACAALNPERSIVTHDVVGGICANEIFEVFDPMSRIGYGSCAFGPFTPYELPPHK